MRVLPPERIPLIDRVEEIEKLRERIVDLSRGAGGALFVEGEVGVGKTRIMREVIKETPPGVRTVYLTITRIEEPLKALMDKFLHTYTESEKSNELVVAGESSTFRRYVEDFRENGGVVVEVSMKETPPRGFLLKVYTEGEETTEAHSPEILGNLLLYILRYNRGNALIIWEDLGAAQEVFPGEKLKRLLQRVNAEARESGSLLVLMEPREVAEQVGIKEVRELSGEILEKSIWGRAGGGLSPLFAASVLRGAARRTPLLLVLEDLHLSSRAFMNTLHYLMRELKSEPILLLGTYRVELGKPTGSREVANILKRVTRERLFDKITLRSFDRDAFIQYVEALQPERPLEREELNALYRLSGGNPLLGWELLRNLPTTKSVLELERDGMETVPAGLRVLFMKSQTMLSHEEKRLMGALAVLGESVEGKALLELLGEESEKVFDIIESLIDKGYLREEPDGRVSFAHDVYRENTYDALDEETRMKLHRRVAYYFMRRREALGGGYEERIVHHLREGGEKEYALYFSLQIARRYMAGGDVTSALGLLDAVMDPAPGELPHGLWLKGAFSLAEAYLRRGDYRKAERWVESAVTVASAMGWEEGVRRGEKLKARILKDYGRYDEALSLLTRRMRILDESGNPDEETWKIYYHIGELLFYVGEVRRAREMISNFLQNAVSLSPEVVEAYLLMAEIEQIVTGDAERVEVYQRGAETSAKKLGDTTLIIRTRVRSLREMTRRRGGDGKLKEALRRLEEIVKWTGDATAQLDLAEGALLLGEHEMADRLLSLVEPRTGEERLRQGILMLQRHLEDESGEGLERVAAELERELEDVRIPVLQGRGYLLLSQAYTILGRGKKSQRARKRGMEHLQRLRKNIATGESPLKIDPSPPP